MSDPDSRDQICRPQRCETGEKSLDKQRARIMSCSFYRQACVASPWRLARRPSVQRHMILLAGSSSSSFITVGRTSHATTSSAGARASPGRDRASQTAWALSPALAHEPQPPHAVHEPHGSRSRPRACMRTVDRGRSCCVVCSSCVRARAAPKFRPHAASRTCCSTAGARQPLHVTEPFRFVRMQYVRGPQFGPLIPLGLIW